MKQVDVVVIGLGIMGAAVSWRLAQAGVRVLAVEAGRPFHEAGSSHGASRIFRRAYWEGGAYSPLLDLAHRGWTELQECTGTPLLFPNGGLYIGPTSADMVAGSLRTAVAAGIPHACWDTVQLQQQAPQFAVADGMHALYEPGAYVIAAQQARQQMLEEASVRGALMRYSDSVVHLRSQGDSVAVTLASGGEVHAASAVVTAGPWQAKKLLPELAPWLKPCRIPVYWFQPKPRYEKDFDMASFPLFLYECGDGALLYGIPAGMPGEKGVKIGLHNRQLVPSDPDASDTNSVPPDFQADITRRVSTVLPGLADTPERAKWCWYTMTPDESFILGASLQHPHVFHASACSGHGFKFAPAIGEVMAAMALGKHSPVDIACYAEQRFMQHG